MDVIYISILVVSLGNYNSVYVASFIKGYETKILSEKNDVSSIYLAEHLLLKNWCLFRSTSTHNQDILIWVNYLEFCYFVNFFKSFFLNVMSEPCRWAEYYSYLLCDNFKYYILWYFILLMYAPVLHAWYSYRGSQLSFFIHSTVIFTMVWNALSFFDW